MMSIVPKPKATELSFEEVAAKYPQFPRLLLLKTDLQRRGVYYTKQALSKVDPVIHQLGGTHIFGTRDGILTQRPEALILRDGTSVITSPTPLEQNPYIVDFRDGRLVVMDGGVELEEVEYWTKPDYYNLTTSSGIPMSHVASARPQRIYLMPSRYCHFWTDNQGCLFCDIVNNLKQQKSELNLPPRLKPQDVAETIREALKEPGRFTAICLTSGSDFHGAEDFDAEVDYYIEILKAVGENFATPKFPSQLIATAFTEKQLERIYRETGLLSYTPDIEVLNERLFEWICPGKARWVGYQEWKRRMVRAVDIFGRGRVNTCIVAGVELAKPYGFNDEDAALQAVLAEAEDLASQGVSTVYTVWVPRPGSYLRGQKNASLEYYVRLALGLQELRQKYQLSIDHDDYRRCGNHPDSDLARI
ncbi:MAG TPA: radical SAM protein [Bacillota bacterium]|nr:radical SAM protein [Bacillota bacterium]